MSKHKYAEKKDDTMARMKAEMEAQHRAIAEAKDCIKYPLNEFLNYTIIDVVKMLRRHRNKKITDRFIEQIIWELKS